MAKMFHACNVSPFAAAEADSEAEKSAIARVQLAMKLDIASFRSKGGAPFKTKQSTFSAVQQTIP
jgi:hypothetical protein